MTDTTYMQSETVRGMDGGGMRGGMSPMQKPRAIDAPVDQDAGYTSSDERCASCSHFDGMESCSAGVNGGKCEPMGHCSKFEGGEPAESDGEEMREALEEE